MLTGCNMVTIQFVVMQNHTDYHSLPASLPSSRLPPASTVVSTRRIQGFFCPCDGQYRNPMQVPKLGSKKSQHWTFICLLQALSFPCSVCKDLLSHRALLRLFSSAARCQNSSSHGKVRSRRGKKKSHLQPSILREQHRESPAHSSPLTPSFVQMACVEKRGIVMLEEMNGISQVLYPGYSQYWPISAS